MKLLVTGGAGQLAHALVPYLKPFGEVITTTRDGSVVDGRKSVSMDLTLDLRIQEVIHEVKPDVVINCAAYTAVDRAEAEPELAHQVNAVAPGRIAREAASIEALLIHFSTDYVFSGANTRPWRERDPTVPLNVYGHTKLGGEEAVRLTGCAHLILRTGWVYAAHGRNFLRTMLRLAGERERLQVVNDQTGAPTCVDAISDAVARVLRQLEGQSPARTLGARAGTYHLTAAGETTWFHFAETIFDQAHARGMIRAKPELEAVTSGVFNAPARRPAYSVLDNARIGRTFEVSLASWQEELARCLGEAA